MKEEFLHYIWKTQQFDKSDLVTEEKQKLEIIAAGNSNHDSGPDFFNAQIKIGSMTWSGNIEIHVFSSDWLKHNHQSDAAYDNVILHVVLENDVAMKSNSGKMLPTLVLKNRIGENLLENYLQLENADNEIPCANKLSTVPEIKITNWISRLLAERLENKISELKIELEQNKNDWEETFYRHLARQFGMKVNAEPFQWLAQSLSFKIISKQRENLLQTEALLFGQSGLFPEEPNDIYTSALIREYAHLQTKYNLTPMPAHQWKFMRLRPNNFPSIRISQLAGLFFRQPKLFRKCIETNETSELKNIFEVPASGYWNDHYRFGKIAKPCEKNVGPQTIDTILINTIVPFKFLYGRIRGDENLEQGAISLLEKINSEENKITRQWEKLNVKPHSATESQGLLELKKRYCEKKRCLYCDIGNFLVEKN